MGIYMYRGVPPRGLCIQKEGVIPWVCFLLSDSRRDGLLVLDDLPSYSKNKQLVKSPTSYTMYLGNSTNGRKISNFELAGCYLDNKVIHSYLMNNGKNNWEFTQGGYVHTYVVVQIFLVWIFLNWFQFFKLVWNFQTGLKFFNTPLIHSFISISAGTIPLRTLNCV